MDYFNKLTKRVDLDDENWVEIQQMTWGDSKKSLERAMQMGQGNQIRIDPGAVQVEQMVLSIKSWGGPGFGDRPVNRANILALPQFIGDKLAEEIEAINSPIPDDEKKE